MHPRTRKLYVGSLVAPMFGLQCTAAFANVMMIPFLVEFTYKYGLLIVVVSIVAEAIVYWVWFRVSGFDKSRWPGAVFLSVIANIASAAAGFLILLFLLDLQGNGPWLVKTLVVGFALSVLVEYPVVWFMVKQVARCERNRTMVAVLVANAVSYCLIGGLIFGKDEME